MMLLVTMHGCVLLVLATLAVCAPAPQEAVLVELPVQVEVELYGQSEQQKNATHYITEFESDERDGFKIVRIPKLGDVKGSSLKSLRSGREFYGFKGLPYAQAPVGERRFTAPVPVEPWEGVRDATEHGYACIQVDNPPIENPRMKRSVPPTDQSEDCLLLNVFTPKLNTTSKKLPVLFFVHGGSFTGGSVRDMNPSALLDHDMVLVLPQYRLGPLGYLNLQEEGVPGNAGLLDLVQALRWVHDNIETFGGDPGRVTIGGHSAGAVSVSLLYLSPLTKGLVHAVMPMSGSALAFFGWDYNPKGFAEELARQLKCGNDPEERLKCLRTVSAGYMMRTFSKMAHISLLRGESVGMSGSSPSSQTTRLKVLEATPAEIMKSMKFKSLPMMTGVAKHEGTFVNMLLVSGYLQPKNLTANADYLRYDLGDTVMNLIGANDSAGFTSETAMARFFDPNTLGDFKAMTPGLIDFTGAVAFKTPAREMALRNAQANGTSYLYAFNYYGRHTLTNMGIYHGAEQAYLFPGMNPLNVPDNRVAKNLLELVSNFVTYHNPTPERTNGIPTWNPFSRKDDKYMEISKPMKVKTNFRQELVAARSENYGGNHQRTTLVDTKATTQDFAAITDGVEPLTPSRLCLLVIPLLITNLVLV